MASSVTFKVRDRSDEYSTVTFPIPAVDETNWVVTDTRIAALQLALEAAIIGNIATRSLNAYNVTVNDERPLNPFAQRETGLRLFYMDDVNGKKYNLTIPCPDLTLMGQGGTDLIDLTGSVADPIVAAMQALMVSPEGHGVTIYKGVIVGRRS